MVDIFDEKSEIQPTDPSVFFCLECLVDKIISICILFIINDVPVCKNYQLSNILAINVKHLPNKYKL